MRTPRRVLGYARVSSAEQALGTSLEDQQDAIRAHAQKRGVKVDRMFVEAESAVHEKAERREQIQALMADVRAGDLVLVDKIDRWSRDPEFAYGSIRKILEKDAGFFAIGDDCDPSTPQGDSMLGLRIFFAREEHKRIRLRMVGTRKLLRDRGLYSEGLPPWGYRRQTGKTIDKNVLVIVPEDAEKVRAAFRLCIDGDSISEIARKIGTNKDRVRDVLHARIYLGETRNGSGHWIQGRHEAIVDARTFAAAADALRQRQYGSRVARANSETSTWWLRDLARCLLCGAKMSAAYAGPSGPTRRYYYRCYARCTPKYTSVALVESLASALFEARLVELRQELAHAKAPVPKRPDSVSIDERRDRLQRKRERVIHLYADGAIDRDRMRAEMTKLDDARTRLDAEAVTTPALTSDQARAALRDIDTVARRWRDSNPQERRYLAKGLAKQVRITRDEAPVAVWWTAEEIARRA